MQRWSRKYDLLKHDDGVDGEQQSVERERRRTEYQFESVDVPVKLPQDVRRDNAQDYLDDGTDEYL